MKKNEEDDKRNMDKNIFQFDFTKYQPFLEEIVNTNKSEVKKLKFK